MDQFDRVNSKILTVRDLSIYLRGAPVNHLQDAEEESVARVSRRQRLAV
jgi:hypothetical protein